MVKAKTKSKTKAMPKPGDLVRSSDGRLFFIPKGGKPKELKRSDLDAIVKIVQGDATHLRDILSEGPGVIKVKR